MTEGPILFNAPMVCATLDGTKTQTRRVVASQPSDGWTFDTPPEFGRITSSHPKNGRFGAFIRRDLGTDFPQLDLIPSPYGMPGDRLWVRETWSTDFAGHYPHDRVWYAADDDRRLEIETRDGVRGIYSPESGRHVPFRWRPSIHMPRWASRITLEVTSIRVERLQGISYEDARAEGWNPMADDRKNPNPLDPKSWFVNLWSQINGPDSWTANPWVWVIEFQRVGAKDRS